MSKYKSLRCRYFDDKGRELKPYCNAGRQCTFLHPGDPGWGSANRKPHSRQNQSPPRRNSNSRSRAHDGSSSPTNRRRLPPQSELFLRENPEAVDDRDDRGRTRTTHHNDRRDSRGSPMRIGEAPLPRELKSEEGSIVITDVNLPRTRRAADVSSSRDERPVEPKGIERAQANPESRREVEPTALTYEQSFVQRIIDLSRDVAKMTNRAVQDSAALEKDSERLKTCTDLSNTLSKISSPNAAVVTPALAAVTESHGKNQERVNADFRRLGHVWEDLFQTFMNEIVRSIDSEVELALERLKHEISDQLLAVRSRPFAESPTDMYRSGDEIPGLRKRKMADSDSMVEDRDIEYAHRNIGDPGHLRNGSRVDEQLAKRRRLQDDDLGDSSNDGFDPEMRALVKEMKAKLKEQEDALARLQEENYRLRSGTPISMHPNGMRAPSYPPPSATDVSSSMPGSATSRGFSPH